MRKGNLKKHREKMMRRTGGKDRDIDKARKATDCCKALKLGKARAVSSSCLQKKPVHSTLQSQVCIEIKDHKATI